MDKGFFPGSIITIPDVISAYNVINDGLEKGRSVKNILSLAIWNYQNAKSYKTCSPIWDIQPVSIRFPASDNLTTSASHPHHSRDCGKKHASMYNLMGIGDPCQTECSIHDSDIGNMNRVFLKSVARVVNRCVKLDISLNDQEEEEEVVTSTTRILD